MTDTKQCTKCGEHKPPDQFGWHTKAKGTRRNDCRTCKKAYNTAYRTH